jgi:hypothetical protein
MEDGDYLTLEEYAPVVIGKLSRPKNSYYDDNIADAVIILNHNIQLLSHDRNTGDEFYPPKLINIQQYSREILELDRVITFNDIMQVFNQIWITGVKYLLVSSTYLRSDDSIAVTEKLIFRPDNNDLTLFDIYTQSMLILPSPNYETSSYSYEYTLSNGIHVLIMYLHR